MTVIEQSDRLYHLQHRIAHIRRNSDSLPEATVAIPVNAQADLENVFCLLEDITTYTGRYAIEIVLVINNYLSDNPPEAIQAFESLGIRVVSIANVRKQGEPASFTARMHGVHAAKSEVIISFDADCRVPNATAVLDWYIEQFQRGADTAYTHVDYYDLQPGLTIQLRIFTHHASRWAKRRLMGIPTTRGSNYAVRRSFVLPLYDQRFLADEMNVGPTVKKKGGRIVYSGRKQLRVLTSGRYLKGGWREMLRYFMYRLRYNIRVLPVSKDAAAHTKRR